VAPSTPLLAVQNVTGRVLAVDGWAFTFGTVRRCLWLCPRPSSLYKTAHPSTSSVPTSYYSMCHCNYLCALKG